MSKMFTESDQSFERELDGVKNKFFDAIKSENLAEIVQMFRNEKIKVWQFREEDEYSGK
jgi:hypothetical protein